MIDLHRFFNGAGRLLRTHVLVVILKCPKIHMAALEFIPLKEGMSSKGVFLTGYDRSMDHGPQVKFDSSFSY